MNPMEINKPTTKKQSRSIWGFTRWWRLFRTSTRRSGGLTKNHWETKPADQLSNEKNSGCLRDLLRIRRGIITNQIQTINFTHCGEDGWKTILSFWGLRPIFSCELLVSGRSPLWSGPLVAAGCSTNDMGGEESPYKKFFILEDFHGI